RGARSPPARAALGVHRRACRGRDDRALLDPHRLRGTALREQGARAGRRRDPVRRDTRCTRAGRRRRWRRRSRLRARVRLLPSPARTLMARAGWLFLKDLRILARSPIASAVLIVYPVAVALLIGFALSRGSDRPTVAVFDQVPAGERLEVGGANL